VVEIPDGYVGTIRPRGSVSEAGLHVYLGTVDADYKGELLFVVQNLSSQPLEYRAGARIAQIVISKCELLEPMEVEIYRLRLD
jgi:dUTP pyrophosphatase